MGKGSQSSFEFTVSVEGGALSRPSLAQPYQLQCAWSEGHVQRDFWLYEGGSRFRRAGLVSSDLEVAIAHCEA